MAVPSARAVVLSVVLRGISHLGDRVVVAVAGGAGGDGDDEVGVVVVAPAVSFV